MSGYVYAPDVEPTPKEREAIIATCLDYVESWYDADEARMRRCLHPDLDKRGMVRHIIDTRAELVGPELTSASMMLELTRAGVGRPAADERLAEVAILVVRHHLASALVESNGMVDLLHLMRFQDGWKIVQSIWTLDGGVIANVTGDA